MADSKVQPPFFLGAEEIKKYLNGQWESLVTAVENALRSYSVGKVVQPIRSAVAIDKHEGILFAMPAYDEEKDSLATKIVTVFPQNRNKRIPAVQAVVLLYNADDGRLKAIFDGELITGMRTAAASVVATKYLAPENPEILAILGAGSQARSHYQALSQFYNFKKILVWNINSESAIKLVKEIQDAGLNCELSNTAESAVREADIIVTVTMATKPILKKEWVKEGAHINAVGAPVPEWQELASDLTTSSILYVDSREGALAESGDVIKSKAHIYAEIGEVILGSKIAYPKKTTIFKSLGMAVEDVAAAQLVYDNYIQHIHCN